MEFFIELEQKNLKICMETQKTLSKESNVEKQKQSWRNLVPCLQTILPKAIFRFSVIPIKLPMAFSTELEKIISQLVWKYKEKKKKNPLKPKQP